MQPEQGATATILKDLVTLDWTAPFSPEQASDLFRGINLPTAILLPFYHLFEWDQVIGILDGLEKHRGGHYFIWDGIFRKNIYPYLTDPELAALRDAVRRWTPQVEWPNRGRASWVITLAGQIGGMEKELKAGLDALPEAAYHRTQESYLYDAVFGLSNPEDVILHARRQKLLLHRSEYLGAWLSHTGVSALDWVVGSIAALNKGEGAPVAKAFVKMVNAPEAALAMLELLNTKNPSPAKEWLDSHPREAFSDFSPC